MEGLLHLCGLAAAVCIAYVGLDQLHWDDKEFENNLTEAATAIGDSLLRYGLQKGAINPKDSCELFPFLMRLRLFTLCHVGGVRVKMGWVCRCAHHICLLRHAPLLPFFRKRLDRVVIKWMALVAIVSFLYVSALATWHFETFPLSGCPHVIHSFNVCDYIWSVPAKNMIPYFYATSATILIWVCATGYLSQRLQEIKARCARLDARVNAYADKMKTLIQTKFFPITVPPTSVPATLPMPAINPASQPPTAPPAPKST